jgi:hypothetical protein
MMLAEAKTGNRSSEIILGYILFQSFVAVASLLVMVSIGLQFKVNKSLPKDKAKWLRKGQHRVKSFKEAQT